LADALDSKSSDRKVVWVRPPPSARALGAVAFGSDKLPLIRWRHGSLEPKNPDEQELIPTGTGSASTVSPIRRLAYSPSRSFRLAPGLGLQLK